MKHGMLKSRLAAAWIIALAVMAAAAATSATMKFTPFGERDITPVDMTADGSKLVAIYYLGAPYFTWTAAGGLVNIGGGCLSGQPAISGDGSTIFGTACDETGLSQAAKWLGGTQWQLLGSVPGGVSCDVFLSSGWDVDHDGSTGVGLAWLPQLCHAHAATWNLTGGGPATDLGSLVPNHPTRANAISGDGRIIGGWQDDEIGNRQGARWVDGIEHEVLTGTGEHVGEVQHLNYDGSVMIGNHYPYGSDPGWVWTADHGFTALPNLDAIYSEVVPVSASNDGQLVVGAVRERVNGQTRAVFWQGGRAADLRDYLSKVGLAPGWDLRWLTAVSGDGATLAGWGLNPEGFIEGFVITNFR
jgi:uncharacterized membrane protein